MKANCRRNDSAKDVFVGYVTRDHEVKSIRSDKIPEKYDGHDYLIALNHSFDTRIDSSWRYRKDLNLVCWDVVPDEDRKKTLEGWLQKNLGVSNPTHKLIDQNDIMSWIRKGSGTRIAHGIDESDKMFGYDFKDIQRAQQGGQLNRPLPPVDIAKRATEIQRYVDKFKDPIGVIVVKKYGIKLPPGYKLVGDDYVYSV